MTYVLDTNIFNWLVDKLVDHSELPTDGDLVVTHLQVDEVSRISDEDRRARVFLTLACVITGVLPTESAICDVSRLDHCKLGDGAIYTSVKSALDARNGRQAANTADALIAEVALANDFTLLTADRDLAEVADAHGGRVALYKRRANATA
ncbi:MAG: PIN domain-containing protein [Candidatus Eiseniibacteriota bacterium]